MRKEDVFTIGFWLLLYVIAIVRIVAMQAPWELVRHRMLLGVRVLLIVVVVSAVSGFAMSGYVGLAGMALFSLLAGGWCVFMYAPVGNERIRRKPTGG